MESTANLEIFNQPVISPYEEMIAYETLWAINGMTEARLSQLFRDTDALPSKVLKENYGQQSLLESEGSIASLQKRVAEFIDRHIGRFSIVVNRDFQYPLGLRNAKYPPELFYYKGDLDLLKTRCISVVGARKATQAGVTRAERLAKELVERDFTIVSGLAAGIDTAALTSAIAHKGRVIAVLGTPIDQYYPKENKDLQDQIAKEFLLISQVQFYRYSMEHFDLRRHHFPRRNETMASISEATIIVEASDASGSFTQARACMSQNKKLFILESCFHKAGVAWPFQYEKKGAIRVKKTGDILKHLTK